MQDKTELIENIPYEELQKLVQIHDEYHIDDLVDSSIDVLNFIDLSSREQEQLMEIHSNFSLNELDNIKDEEFEFNEDIDDCDCDDTVDMSFYDLMKKEITDDIFEKYNLEELQKIQKNINEIL